MKIMFKEINIDNSLVLFDEPFSSDCLSTFWTVHGGEWEAKEGWLTIRFQLVMLIKGVYKIYTTGC
ncbi:MAG: hypothetical protein A2Y21_03810 [Clostridiales bacterium GWC2_40_7]|nr:MAG: hypothetical protein A2Y21_03810 [Clostridiales bacterium GWC2_40_7]